MEKHRTLLPEPVASVFISKVSKSEDSPNRSLPVESLTGDMPSSHVAQENFWYKGGYGSL